MSTHLSWGWAGRAEMPPLCQGKVWDRELGCRAAIHVFVIPNLGSPGLRNASYHDPELAKILINASDEELKCILVINKSLDISKFEEF